jgi:hypothetical protein
VAGLLDVGHSPSGHLCLSRVLVKRHRLPFLDTQRTGGADTEAKARAIAKLLPHHPRLSVDEDDSTLGARRHARAAPVAEFLINPHNLSNCHIPSRSTLSPVFSDTGPLAIHTPDNLVGTSNGLPRTD